ncbi:MAG: isochorismatase family protein [Polyangiaceae bacterium]|nr:isochorismatase family protein [Polyangiaceae bacterium]
MLRLEPSSTAVVLIDVQGKLAATMPAPRMHALQRAAAILGAAAPRLGAALMLTEQYPKGLGKTLEGVDRSFADADRFEKMSFSAWDCSEFQEALKARAPKSVVLLGMETHICVFQTARDLCGAGFEVLVPIDGVCSRQDDHYLAGLAECERAGARRTTSETVLFDWLRDAGTDEFRELSRLVR